MLYILILILFLSLMFSYFTLGRDIFQPSCIVNAVWLISAICALINQHYWQYVYHEITIFVILAGLITIYLVNLLFARNKLKCTDKSQNNNIKRHRYKIRPLIMLSLILVQLISIFFYFKEIIRITGGGSSLNSIMSVFRASVSYSTEASVSFLVTQLSNFSFAIAFVFVFVFVNNYYYNGLKKNLCNLIPIFIYFVQAVMLGGRYNIIILVIAAISDFGLMNYQFNHNSKLKFSLVVKLGILLLLTIIAFYFLKGIVGRTSNLDIVTYLARYIGGPIPLFDMFLQDPVINTDIWGKETFFGLLSGLRKLGIIDFVPYIGHLEFRTFNGLSLGNVYGAFRRNIADFGIGGMLILQAIFSGIMSFLYNRVKKGGKDIGVILYSSIVYSLYMHFYGDDFYIRVLSIRTLAITIMILVVYWFIVRNEKVNVKLKKVKTR